MSFEWNPDSPGVLQFSYVADSALSGGTDPASIQDVPAIDRNNLWVVEIDNTLNAIPVYVKIWGGPASSVTLGSTPPRMQFAAAASTKQTYSFAGKGCVTYASGSAGFFSMACLIEPGTTGTIPPTAAVQVKVYFSYEAL